MTLHTSLEKVKVGDRANLLHILRNIADFDMDFNGDNGEDYTWEEALENGFESNLEYVIDYVKDIESDEECVETFFKEWMDNDGYYAEYDVNCLTDSKGRVTAISFAYVCGL